jgi:hypothetical protein
MLDLLPLRFKVFASSVIVAFFLLQSLCLWKAFTKCETPKPMRKYCENITSDDNGTIVFEYCIHSVTLTTYFGDAVLEEFGGERLEAYVRFLYKCTWKRIGCRYLKQSEPCVNSAVFDQRNWLCFNHNYQLQYLVLGTIPIDDQVSRILVDYLVPRERLQ